jgi:sphingolipid delta-4 desaturase
MNIPGRYLPKYYKITKEFYQHLDSTHSWTRMFYDFITKPNLGADKRYVRSEQVRKQGIKMAEAMKRERESV